MAFCHLHAHEVHLRGDVDAAAKRSIALDSTHETAHACVLMQVVLGSLPVVRTAGAPVHPGNVPARMPALCLVDVALNVEVGAVAAEGPQLTRSPLTAAG